MAHDKLLGIYWDSGKPALHTRQHDQPGLALGTGIYLSLGLSGVRHCIGYYDEALDTRQNCQDNREMEAGRESQCIRCQHDGGTFAAKSGIADSLRGNQLLSAQHDVYLALFGKDVVKVGVTRSSRREVRLLEQAAHASIIIASGDGEAARVLERQIHTQAGLPETIKLATKLEKLTTVATPDEANRILLETTELVRSQVASTLPSLDTDFTYHFPRYDIRLPSDLTSLRYIDRLDDEAVVSGRLVGALGRCLLLHNGVDEKVYALDSVLIEGYEADTQLQQNQAIESRVTGVHAKHIDLYQQGSLF